MHEVAATIDFPQDISQQGSPALEIEHVSYRYGARCALSDVSFVLPRGQLAVLLGPNGAGKSTLFSLITRLYHTRTGQIRVFGHDLARRSSQALACIGVVFQQRTLDLDLSVAQNLRYHAALHGLPRRETERRISEGLGAIGLTDRANDKVRELSGGQGRRLEIARALLHHPRLLLCDEATVGLDIDSRQTVLDAIRAFVRNDGLTILWATHLIDEVAPADRVIILHKGQIKASGSAHEIARAAAADDIRGAYGRLTAEAAK